MAIRHSVSSAAALLIGAGVVAGSLSGCSISPPSAAAETEEIYVRMLHAVPGAPALGVLAGDGGEGLSSTLYFGMLSSYRKMQSGHYDLGISQWNRGLGEEALSDLDLVAKEYADLSQREFFTVMAVGTPSRISVVVLTDDQPPLFDQALVRFVHVMPDVDTIQWTAPEDEIYVPMLGYGEVSEYVPVAPGFSTFELREVSFSESEMVRESEAAMMSEGSNVQEQPAPQGQLLETYDIDLHPGRVYTIFSTGLLRGEPQLGVMVAEQGNKDL